MKRLPEQSVDLVLCDLPYGQTDHPDDRPIPLAQLWECYRRLLKEDGAVVLFAMQPFTTKLINSQPEWFRYAWVWDKRMKTGFLNARKCPMRAHEDILVFSPKRLGGFTYNPQMRRGSVHTRCGQNRGTTVYSFFNETEPYKSDEYYPDTILRIAKENFRKRIHPNEKPVALLEYLIRTYTNAGATVLDNTMGSGSTIVAAIHTGRNAIGIEKNRQTYLLARRRIQQELRAA